jgi:hypothetical protein
MDEKKADQQASQTISVIEFITPLKFCTGNAGRVQKKIIRHLLALVDGGFDRLTEPEKLQKAGTDAIRLVAEPFLNPLEYISQLRKLNVDDCILSVPVDGERKDKHGRAPAYYLIPGKYRWAWRIALRAAS